MENHQNRTNGLGLLTGAKKDRQSITSDWTLLKSAIDGVRLKEVRNVPKQGGSLTEVFRRDWLLDDGVVDQVFQVILRTGEISTWHMHQYTLDRLFVSQGLVKIALYDGRRSSPTCGKIAEYRLGTIRSGLVVVPPGVWHAVQNIADEPSAILNLVDKAYAYEDPDHWRLPYDTTEIPYRFEGNTPF